MLISTVTIANSMEILQKDKYVETIAQWCYTCLAYVRLWVEIIVPELKNKTLK